MKIDILCSSPDHPVNDWLAAWVKKHDPLHDIRLLHDRKELSEGDLLFLVSCSEIIRESEREAYTHALVLHASDLPKGRGWSPHVWALLENAGEITVSLIDARDPVDTGDVWAKRSFAVPPHALCDEINAALFKTELQLMDKAIEMTGAGARPVPQDSAGVSYYPKRSPSDGEIDPDRPLAELFNSIRVADPKRYPAFFRLNGYLYTIELTKVGKDGTDQN